MRVSVVIPTLNEARRLPGLLATLRGMALHEILVVDASSADGTAALAAEHGARVIPDAPRGRGRQLALGAQAATGEVVWFVHADATPPPGSVDLIRGALKVPGVVGGAFLLHTVDDGDGVPLGPLVRLADVRSRYTHAPYGDQAIFCRRDALERAGGVPPVALFEDLALSHALRRQGRLVTVDAEVVVSGRRFTRGPLRAMAWMNVLPVLWRLGVSSERLAAWYGDVR